MAKIFIFRGPTGCGKTYQAFNRLNSKKSAIYLAPCRQLVYESAMKYGTLNSEVVTSDLHMFKKGYDFIHSGSRAFNMEAQLVSGERRKSCYLKNILKAYKRLY